MSYIFNITDIVLDIHKYINWNGCKIHRALEKLLMCPNKNYLFFSFSQTQWKQNSKLIMTNNLHENQLFCEIVMSMCDVKRKPNTTNQYHHNHRQQPLHSHCNSNICMPIHKNFSIAFDGTQWGELFRSHVIYYLRNFNDFIIRFQKVFSFCFLFLALFLIITEEVLLLHT